MNNDGERRILVVEDEAAVAKGLVFGLKEEGYTVKWVDTGALAVKECTAFQPHLIVLDIRLPELNGLEVGRKLREKGQRMPVIMVTAGDEEADRIMELEMGADDYVVKPFSLRELVSRIRAHLRRAYGEYAGEGRRERVRTAPAPFIKPLRIGD